MNVAGSMSETGTADVESASRAGGPIVAGAAASGWTGALMSVRTRFAVAACPCVSTNVASEVENSVRPPSVMLARTA